MEESTLGFLQLQVFYSFSPKKVEFSGYKEHQMVLEKYNRKSWGSQPDSRGFLERKWEENWG